MFSLQSLFTILFRKEIRGGYNFLRFVYLDKKEILMKKLKNKYTAAVILVLLLLIDNSQNAYEGFGCIRGTARSTELRFELKWMGSSERSWCTKTIQFLPDKN